MLKVVHVAPRVQAQGGIETLLARHRAMAFPQFFVALFDRGPALRSDYANLDCTWRTPLWIMRRRLRAALARHPGSLVVYHNGWGLPLFHDLDGAARRLVVFHADPAYHAPDLPGFAGLVDGVLEISPEMRAARHVHLPDVDDARAALFHVPIRDLPVGPRHPRAPGSPLILGYAGRVERAQKRLDRLPEFLRAAAAGGLDCRFEIIGDGRLLPALRRTFDWRVQCHGWTSDADYARLLGRWDAAVYFSEHEGGPIALLEAMALGVVPFYPAQSGSWADFYAPQVDPLCHYPVADMPALVRSILSLFARPEPELARLRERCRSLIEPHRGPVYEAVCAGLFERLEAWPRISRASSRTTRVTDCLPLGLATRLFPRALRRA